MALLELRRRSKSFPGVHALRHIDLDVEAGEVHAILGENGAGKSTLSSSSVVFMKAISGSIRFHDEMGKFPVRLRKSQCAGIRTLHQEFNLLPQLTVAEYIFLVLNLAIVGCPSLTGVRCSAAHVLPSIC